MKKISGASIIIMILFFSASCARFKVDKLSSTELFRIPIGPDKYALNYPEQQGLHYEVPGRVAVVDNLLAISEPSNNRIKLFKENQLQIILSGENSPKFTEDVAKSPTGKSTVKQVVNKNLNVPGALAAGSENDFFVINYVPTTALPATPEAPNSGGYYKILHFDTKGNFLHLIGREGRMDMPFESILWMDTDEENNLWVLHKYIDSLTLDQYKDGQLVRTIAQKKCDDALFSTDPADGTVVRQCEEMYPFYDGDRLLLIGREDRIPTGTDSSNQVYQFQRRVYKVMNIKDGKTETVFGNMNDPEDYPYIPYESSLLIWKTPREDRFKIALYDLDGDLLKYFQIELPDRRQNWRSTYATLAGNFYSLRLQSRNLYVYQWK